MAGMPPGTDASPAGRAGGALRHASGTPEGCATAPQHASDTSDERARTRVAAIVPAKDEAARIAATVTALRGIRDVGVVIVVDDGSSDGTAVIAREAGARVLVHDHNRGKAAALQTAIAALPAVAPAFTEAPVLFADADLEASAGALAVLVAPVLDGEADLTIATLPAQRTAGGGRGFVVSLGRSGIRQLTGREMAQPLSGMRCLDRAALDAALPFASGWGVEVGMTVDVLAAGLRVLEVPCELHHRVTGSDWRGQLHRARQYRDVWLALAQRRLRRRRGAH